MLERVNGRCKGIARQHQIIHSLKVIEYSIWKGLSLAALISVSGYWIQNHISEGKRPMYHIIDNDLNSTTALNGGGNNIHLESQANHSGVLIKSRQGIKEFTSVYPQYAMTLFDVQSYAGAVQVNINNLCWIPSGTKFACTGNTRYRFGNLYNQLRADTATMWIGGKMPNVLTQENLTITDW